MSEKYELLYFPMKNWRMLLLWWKYEVWWWLWTQAYSKGSTLKFVQEWELELQVYKAVIQMERAELQQWAPTWEHICQHQHKIVFRKETQGFIFLVVLRVEVKAPRVKGGPNYSADYKHKHISIENKVSLHPVTGSKALYIQRQPGRKMWFLTMGKAYYPTMSNGPGILLQKKRFK